MVHALRECWRVLRPGGLLLDLRPIASARPVERIGPEGSTPIGAIDGSAGLPEDLASEAALRVVARERRFAHQQTRRFDLFSHWPNVSQLLDHLARPSPRRHPLASQEANRWLEACRDARDTRVRSRERMQLGVYQRCGIGPSGRRRGSADSVTRSAPTA